jgi:hypothetical protein
MSYIVKLNWLRICTTTLDRLGLSVTSTADRRVDESGSLAYERHRRGNLGLTKDECRK